MALAVAFPRPRLSSFLLQMSIHMRGSGQPRLAPSVLCNMPILLSGRRRRMRVFTSELYYLPTLWPRPHVKFQMNDLSENVRRRSARWHGSQFPAPHANCVLTFGVKKKVIYTSLVSAQTCKLSLAAGNETF